LALAACVSPEGPTSALETADGLPLKLSRERIEEISYGVFEIVVPKRSEMNLTYVGGRTLPVEELPFQQRNDKYEAIGTAFALQSGRLVSAAHVFQLDRHAAVREFFARDRFGRVYAVDSVMRFSQYRDLIEIKLDKEPPRVEPLTVSADAAVGDTVYTVGNANGEGIAVRDGQIASFTFEPVAGAWKDVRFSAPASPGNSGGPLLNTRGQVIGVVVRKNANENLNVAVPIAELTNLSAKKAEFFAPSSEANRDGEPRREWRYRTKLPQSIDKLARKAEASRRRFHLTQWQSWMDSRKQATFPRDPLLQDYLWDQTYAQHMQILSYNEKRGYHLTPKAPVSDAVTAAGEQVYTLIDEPHYSMVQIEIPPSASHIAYVKQPAMILDAVVEAFALYREFNGRRIPIKSFGPPQATGMFVDTLGRPWLKATWRTHFNLSTIQLNCLTAPLGFGCTVDMIDTADETRGGQEKFERHHAAEIAMSYWGDVKAWKRFLALSKRFVPSFLHGMTVAKDAQGVVSLAARDVKMRYKQPLFSDKSWLFLGVGYGMGEALKPEVQLVKLEHGAGWRVSEELEVVAEPPQSSPVEEKTWWVQVLNGGGAFNGKASEQGDKRRVFRMLGLKPGAKGRKIVQFVSCTAAKDNPARASIEATCDSIKKGYDGTNGALAH